MSFDVSQNNWAPSTDGLSNPSGQFLAVEPIDPGITPKMDAPWIDFLQEIGGYLQSTAIVAGGIIAVLLLIQMMFSKLAKRSMDDEAVSKLVWILVACALVTAISSVIRWASGLSVLFIFD